MPAAPPRVGLGGVNQSRFNLGGTARKQGGPAMAGIPRAERGIAAPDETPGGGLNSDLAISYRDQAILLSQQGRFAESETYSREALRLRPDDINVLNELGAAVWRQGRPAEAEAIYLRACQIQPNDFRILTNLGLA